MQRVTRSTRWALCAIPWFFLLSFAEPVTESLKERPVSAALSWALVTVFVTQSVLATVVLAHRIGHRGTLRGLTATVVVLSCLQLAVLPVLHRMGWPESGATGYYCVLVAAPLAAVLNGTSVRTYSASGAAVCAFTFVAAATTGFPLHQAFPTACAVAASWLVIGLTLRSSAWYLAVMWQLDAAREAQGQLAVAEERLRFARDLHDVMGRNLAVIALKSELAARLGEVNDPRAGSEMVEVQRLARQSQKEIREVVRGYRTTNLAGELAGARSVLQAAGITSTIESDLPPGLSNEAESVLGWAIREGVTNILRHSDARNCTIRFTENDGTELLIANDRAHSPGSQAGTGLGGLAQRLAPLGGSLRHGPGSENTYRLVIRLPTHSEQKATS
ncbi:histidine kinase [Streptomyces sp. ALI-76-A]|jgi:two-component system sensor histidine kinase DesK|uniref:sensor histidine kinase n=1 Tax=Streptomyces sp. ALI-76-A TaxID=3025736 RepID=UPI00256F1F11|nr:histidine kinase [Streptomyces sp. ALI-76-A]MDL5206009.1 histidine kinase [Streptomyces sp. ALI-76-A]